MHQPYLFPYRGYFDLIASVDKFVFYDDAKFMKGKFINRNYFQDLFTFRLKKHSDFAKINQCYFFNIEDDKKRFLKTTKLKAEKYLKPLRQEDDLSINIRNATRLICQDLGITTPLYLSSSFSHGKGVQGILDIVRALKGNTYVNLPGGKDLYSQDMFGDIKLEFLETKIGPSILYEECL